MRWQSHHWCPLHSPAPAQSYQVSVTPSAAPITPPHPQIQGLEDVYTGGRQQDRLALGVEVALTRKDEYGRILTPKEAFRQLCYKCVVP